MNKELENLRQFYNLLSELTEDDINLLINKIDFNTIANYFLESHVIDDDCEILIKVLQYIYNNTGIVPPISDDKYDRLYAMYIESRKDIVGAKVVSDKNIKSHRYPDLRGTLDKLHYFYSKDKRDNDSRKSVEDWVGTIKRIMKDEQLDRSYFDVDIYPKWDGISCVFECDEDGKIQTALTRGDTEKNEAVDITPIFGGIRLADVDVFPNSEKGIKTEIIMTNENFEKVKSITGFNNPRSTVSGLLNSDEPNIELVKYLTIVPLRAQEFNTKEIEVLDFLDFKETSNLYDLEDLEEKSLRLYNKIKDNYPTDGVVFVLTNKKMHKILGRKDNINKFEAAFKFPAETKRTILKDVTFSIGKLGGITPVAVVEPVVIKGNTITNASLGSIDRFKKLGLAIGDEVEIQYEIIPYLEPVKHNGGVPIQVPSHCPTCGEKLEYTPLLSCTNDKCPSVRVGKILNFIEKMGISFISIGTLTKLIGAGIVRDIDDIYKLSENRNLISQLDGLGDKTINKIVSSLNSRNNIPMHQLLGSIGIDSIGRRTFKKVCEYYNINSLEDIYAHLTKIEDLLKIEGIKSITAGKIVKGIVDNMDLIEKLLKYNTIIPYTNNKVKFDKMIYFTNVRDPEFGKFLQSKGIGIADSFNKKVDMLIVPDVQTKESKKVSKAEEWNIPVVKISDAKTYFKYN